jgi:pectate lyase-like protein/parallel beta helix pectate lyase-like protein
LKRFPSGSMRSPKQPSTTEHVALSRRALGATLLTGAGLTTLAGLSACTTSEQVGTTPRADEDASPGGATPRWVDFLSDLTSVNNTTTHAVVVRNHSLNDDGGGGLFHWVTGTATSDNGTIVVPTDPNGGYWKRVSDGPVNVRWFGARGDGASDDTIAIQAAIDAVASLGAGGLFGGTVLIPPGTFCADKLCINAHRVTLTGAGKTSILAKNGAGNALLTIGPAEGVENVTVRDLMITTKPGVAPAGWAVFGNSCCSWITLDNLYICDMACGIGLEPTFPRQVHNALIRNCVANLILHQGVALFNCIDTFISDSGIFMNGFGAGSVGLLFSSGSDGLYASNLIITQGETPLAIQNGNPGIGNNQPPRHGYFSQLAVDGGTGSSSTIGSIVIQNGHRIHFDQCWVAGNANGIVIRNDETINSPSCGIEFSNCTVLNCTLNGVDIQGAKNIGITGGQYISNRCAGIHVASGGGSSASGIRIVGVRSGSDSDFLEQAYGLYLEPGTKHIVVQGCDFLGNSTQNLVADGVGYLGQGSNLGCT